MFAAGAKNCAVEIGTDVALFQILFRIGARQAVQAAFIEDVRLQGPR